jgi:putative peptidoglycan lipid II flippase
MSESTSRPDAAGSRKSMPAVMVAAGMLLSRVSGYGRVVLFSHIFGVNSVAADAFSQALRIPNFLQNLFGEGVLSASLIPVYAGLLKREQQQDADRVARAVLGLLVLVTAAIVLVGMTWTPALITVIAPGFAGERRALTIELVRILFPGIALLVFSAWCLAILNSHHRFFLAYVAPVFWNAAMITTLLVYRNRELPWLAVALAWAAVVGGGLQLGVQVPSVWRIMAPAWTRTRHRFDEHVRRVLVTSLPVIFSRGIVQVSAYIDALIATFLPPGAPAALMYATQLYQLPVGLFGMAVSSAALPSLSAAVAVNVPDLLRERMLSGQRAIAVLVIPSMIAFLAFGDVIIGLLLQGGVFSAADTTYVWAVLAGSAVGLLATTVGRLYSAAFYALGDTRTPMRFAIVRVALVTGLGWVLALVVPSLIGIAARWGTAGLTVSAGLAGWVEFLLLRRTLQRRIGAVAIPASFLLQTWGVAVVAAAPAMALRWVIPPGWLIARGLVILGTFGALYLAAGHWLGLLTLDEVRRMIARPRRRPRADA